jgi:hypothetical protein
MSTILRSLLLCALAVQAFPARAVENVDPANKQAQFAYSENAGWLSAEPLGDGGPGVEVGDSALAGWLWSESFGWISLSCQNTASCAAVDYGVKNDGTGRLSGLAWAENVGWIDFAPSIGATPVPGAGVRIDPASGRFSGHAWSENLGWIRFHFASAAAAPFAIQTSWRPASSPTATPTPAGGTPVPTATATPTGGTPGPTGSVTPTPPGTIPSVPASSAGLTAVLFSLILALAAGRLGRPAGVQGT